MIRRMVPEIMVVATITVSMGMASYMILDGLVEDVACDSLRTTTTRALHDAQVVSGGLPTGVVFTHEDTAFWNLPEKAWGAGTGAIDPERRECPSGTNGFFARAAGSYVSLQCAEHGTTEAGERPEELAAFVEDEVSLAELPVAPAWWRRNMTAIGLILISAVGAFVLRQSRQAAIVQSDNRTRVRMRFAPK